MPKILVGERAFCAVFQRISGSEDFEKEGEEYQEFPWKVFRLTVAKMLVGEQPFCAVLQKISGSEKFWKRRGSIKSFRGKFFVSRCRKFW